MEPFLAIGEMLKKKGHQVICAFPDQFKELTDQSGLGFAPLGPDSLDILTGKEAKIAFGGKSLKIIRILSTLKMFLKFHRSREAITLREFEIIQNEKPDIVLHNALNLYAFIWGFKPENTSILVSAIPYIIHRIEEHPYVTFNRNFSSVFNKATYLVSNWALADSIRQGYRHLKVPGKPSNRKIRNFILQGKMVFTISPTLVSRPDDWNNNVQILGFQERDKKIHWNPPTGLELFLNNHDKILFVTFGSITNPNPEEKTELILNVLEKHHIPAVINTAAGGLAIPSEYNEDLFYFVSQIPYDWILPKVYGIVHHGGSGTTHTALKHGCATLIIPHIFDQFAWNKIIADNGLGPKGIQITKITEKNLEPLILDLINNTAYKEKAEEISQKMKREDLEEELYRFIMDEKEGIET